MFYFLYVPWPGPTPDLADINECTIQGICQNGDCLNTLGSFKCSCKAGLVLDGTRCVGVYHLHLLLFFLNYYSLTHINPALSCDPDPESPPEYGQCFRMVSSARGCELPLSGNLTQEVCCCSVGKAWGRSCERCPLQGTGEWSAVGQERLRAERQCRLTLHFRSFKLVAYCLLLKGSPLAGRKAGRANLSGVYKKKIT